MKSSSHRSRTKAGAAIGAVLTGMIFFVLVVVGGIWVKQDREKLIDQIGRLQTELSTAHDRIEELDTDLRSAHRARRDAEETADAAGRAALEAREQLASHQKRLGEEVGRLQAALAEREQQIAAAVEARTQAEEELARETDRRQAVEQQVAQLQDRLQQQESLVSELQAPADTNVEPLQDAGERVATTTRPPRARVETMPAVARVDESAQTRPQASENEDASSEVAEPVTTAKQAFDGDETLAGNDRSQEASNASVAAFDTPPQPVNLVSPDYPRELRQRGAEGRVVVAFTVNRQGRVEDVEVKEATHRDFESAAVEAVQRWRFKPATRHGEPVDVRISQRLDFTDR